MPKVISLQFAAPVPRGHDVLVVTFSGQVGVETVVLDRTVSTLYCSDRMFDIVQQYPEHAVTDPIALVTRWAWTVRESVQGTSAGSVVGTSRAVSTRLLVEPQAATAPYR